MAQHTCVDCKQPAAEYSTLRENWVCRDHFPTPKEIKRRWNAHDDLLAAASETFGLIEEQLLVRDISNDHKPFWSVNALKITNTVKNLRAAIKATEGGK